jgi:hypothetical protein
MRERRCAKSAKVRQDRQPECRSFTGRGLGAYFNLARSSYAFGHPEIPRCARNDG